MPRWAFAVVDLWLRCRAAGATMLGGVAVLPGSGGMGDQPAALMDAFDILDAASRPGNDDAGDS